MREETNSYIEDLAKLLVGFEWKRGEERIVGLLVEEVLIFLLKNGWARIPIYVKLFLLHSHCITIPIQLYYLPTNYNLNYL